MTFEKKTFFSYKFFLTKNDNFVECPYMKSKSKSKQNRTGIPVGIQLDHETFNAYKRIAEAERRTMSNVLRIALQDHLQSFRSEPVEPQREQIAANQTLVSI